MYGGSGGNPWRSISSRTGHGPSLTTWARAAPPARSTREPTRQRRPGRTIASHRSSPTGRSSNSSTAPPPSTAVPRSRAGITRLRFATTQSPARSSSGSSVKRRSSHAPAARSSTSSREASRGSAGSCAISSGGSSYSKRETSIANASVAHASHEPERVTGPGSGARRGAPPCRDRVFCAPSKAEPFGLVARSRRRIGSRLRYRDGRQGCFSRTRLLGHHVRHEGPAMGGDAVDGMEQFTHRRDEGDLGQLATRDERLVVRAQPGVAADRAEDGHVEFGAQASRADRGEAGAGRGALPRLPEARDGAHVASQSRATAHAAEIAEGGDEAGGRLGTDPVDGRQPRADLVAREQTLDIPVERAPPPPQDVQVLADVLDLDPVGRAVVLPDGGRRGLEQCGGHLGPDLGLARIPQAPEPSDRDALKRDGRG